MHYIFKNFVYYERFRKTSSMKNNSTLTAFGIILIVAAVFLALKEYMN